jgi:SAM-dependent methyltransferase
MIRDEIAGRSFVRTETVNCPLCGDAHQAREISARFGMKAMVAECPKCRLAYQSPRPSEEACIAYMDWRWASNDGYVSDTQEKREVAAFKMQLVKQACGDRGDLLDFGAGSGVFVRAAIDGGWLATGVEHSTSAITRAKHFYNVDLLREIPDKTFDVITLWDVIEHLKEPIELLSILRTRLRPGGSIFVETGNYESWMRVAKGDKWGLYLLDHHYYFSPTSLKATLDKAGFSEFSLMSSGRKKPSLFHYRDWLVWRRARQVWPEHAELHTMVALAKNSETT